MGRNPRTGEAVKVVIVKNDPSLTNEAVIDYCKGKLTGYKMPRIVEFRSVLPKSPIGKVLRRELRGDAAATAQAASPAVPPG